ncbi:hypothetical protein [Microbacterium tumbae]
MSIRITVDGSAARVYASSGPGEAPPFATALVEVRGGLLLWSVPPQRFPDALVHSPVEAAAWLSEIYGDDVAAAVRGMPATHGADAGPDPIALPAGADLVDAVRGLALLVWARTWWPAGRRIPRLDPDVLAAEIVRASHAVDHLLDDEEATGRALADAIDAPAALAALPRSLADEAETLARTVTELADDHGVALSDTVRLHGEDWALAAGGAPAGAEGVEIGHGTGQVRWADVPAQTVAADAEARWSLQHSGGEMRLSVEADAVADAPDAGTTLRARFGAEETGVDVLLTRSGALFSGSMPVPASLALLPLEQRTLWVRDPASAAFPGPAEPESIRRTVIDFAAARIADPGAGLAERAAGPPR